jgi:hypothetical protein
MRMVRQVPEMGWDEHREWVWESAESGEMARVSRMGRHTCIVKPPSAGAGCDCYLDCRAVASSPVTDPRLMVDVASWGRYQQA